MSKYFFFLIHMLFFSVCFSQIGINTQTPQKTLHVNGTLQVTNEINLGGSSGTSGQILRSNGPGQPATWENMAGGLNSTGTVMVVGGKYVVAQEITVNMASDFAGPAVPGATIATNIGSLTDEVIDNENRYSGNGSSNTFQVSADGVYKVIMNMQLSTTNNTYPVVGIWDNTTNLWVARVNDVFAAPTNGFQTYTLMTSLFLAAGKDYSFRAANTVAYTIKALSSGATGSGPVSEVSVKRLK
ncbi:hypothetical protein [Chryseobacterium lactis]|nr:hypothetical protein [Chryseobacterium lactis]